MFFTKKGRGGKGVIIQGESFPTSFGGGRIISNLSSEDRWRKGKDGTVPLAVHINIWLINQQCLSVQTGQPPIQDLECSQNCNFRAAFKTVFGLFNIAVTYSISLDTNPITAIDSYQPILRVQGLLTLIYISIITPFIELIRYCQAYCRQVGDAVFWDNMEMLRIYIIFSRKHGCPV